jgi:hypothetical protein
MMGAIFLLRVFAGVCFHRVALETAHTPCVGLPYYLPCC